MQTLLSHSPQKFRSLSFTLAVCCLGVAPMMALQAADQNPVSSAPVNAAASTAGGVVGKEFSGPQRTYMMLGQRGLAGSPFVAETTVTLHSGAGGGGCAFFGVGSAQPDPNFYDEPTIGPSLYLRIAPSDFAQGAISLTVNGKEVQKTGGPGDGTHRLRLIWLPETHTARLEVHPHWKAGTPFRPTIKLTEIAQQLTLSKAEAVFYGGANGVQFSGGSTMPLSPAETERYGAAWQAPNWLPTPSTANTPQRPRADVVTRELDGWLKSLSARIRPLVCEYEGAALLSSRPFQNGTLPDKSWDMKLRTAKVVGQPDALDVVAEFSMLAKSSTASGSAASGESLTGVALAFDFSQWSASNYVMIPASVYNGNRNRVVNRDYAMGLDRSDLYRKDLPLTTVPLPQLSPTLGEPSKIELITSNTATPAICLYDKKARRGFILLAEQGLRVNGAIRDHGLIVEESADRKSASVVVSAPGVRSRRPQFIGFGESPDRGLAFKAGDKVQLRLRLYSFSAPDIPTLLAKFMEVRKAVTGPNQPRNILPASEIIRLMTERKDARFHDGPEFKFYCPENAPWISFGWIGGLMDTFPLLALNDAKHLERVTQTFDFAIPRGQGESGYFYGALNHDGKVFGREGYDEFPEIVLTRKNGDLLFWLVKQFKLLEAQGRGAAIKPAWKQSTERLADAFVRTWKRERDWGNFLNNKTGQIAVYNTTGGAMTIGGLALASQYYHNPEYLKIAEEAANFYYQRDFVKLGLTTGGCADILQNADSETAAAFMTSLMALYEVTGKKEWREKTQNLANLAATWATSYDYELPPDTELGKLGAKLTGTYWASTQNKHGAPGIATSSGDPLFKLYRATGDTRYAELMHDIFHAYAEGVKPGGEITERLGYSDADSRGERGPGSTGWNETNGLMMAMELPGIYVRHDTGRIFVFDHVAAKFISHDKTGTQLQITNPTRFDATISVLSEDAASATKPLGYTAFIGWPKVTVKAGETLVVRVLPSK
jgi:hypothetical protein